MNRRDLFVGAALLATSRALAEVPRPVPAAPGMKLTQAAAQCIAIGQACLRHCLAMLSSGNPSMAGCAKAVADMIPAAQALAAIVPGGGRHTAALARVVGEIVKDCKAECDKHPAMEPCKACADCCAVLLSEIAKV